MCAVTILEDRALADAAKMDAELKAGKYRGPLHGLPWGVKDLFAVKSTPTTWGAADFENRIIDEDAEVVVRLQNAGAVLIAKLSTGQFAQGGNWFRGGTKNPWNLSQSSSGSSVAALTPSVVLNPQPICAQIAGNLYNNDIILSVAHKYQVNTSWLQERPKLA